MRLRRRSEEEDPARWDSLYVPDKQSNREGPQAREPSKGLNGRSYGKDWPNRLSDHQLPRLKDSGRAITSAPEAVRVSAHLALPGCPRAKQLFHLRAQLSLGQSCHKQKSLASMHTGSLW